MAGENQVIFEFLADPSGLKPAVDVMQSLGLISKETMAVITKGNLEAQAAIAKATEATKGQAAAQNTLAQSAKAVAGTVLTGAIKEQTAATEQLNISQKTLSGSYNDLKERAKALDQEFRNTGSQKARLEYLALRGEMKEVELQNRTLVKSMATTSGQFELLSAATSGMFGAMAAGQGIMSLFTDGEEENAEATKKAMKAQQAMVVVMGLAEVARAAHEAGELKTLALSKLTLLQERLGITTSSQLAAAKAKEAAATITSAEAKELEVAATLEQTAAEEGATVASAERLTTQGIENMLLSESVAIRWAGVAAQEALNIASGPIGWAVLAIGALVAGYELFATRAKSAKEQQEDLNKALEAANKLIDERVRQIQATQDFSMQNYEREIANAKAEGKSEREIMELEDRRNEREKEFLEAKYQANGALFNYIAHNYDELNEDTEKLATRAHDIAAEIARRGRGESHQMGESDEELKKMQKETDKKLTLKQKQLSDFNDINKQISENRNKIEEAAAKKRKKDIDDSLRDLKAYYETRATLAKKNSEEELNANKGKVTTQADIDLSNPNLTPNEHADIKVKRDKDIEELETQHKVNMLNIDKELLSMQLEYIRGDIPKRLDIMNRIVNDERQIKISGAKEDANLIEAINKEADEKIKQNTLQAARDTQREKLAIQQSQAQTNLSDAVPGSKGEFDAKLQLMKLAQEQEQLTAKESYEKGALSEAEYQARLTQIDSDYYKKRIDAQNAFDKKQIDDTLSHDAIMIALKKAMAIKNNPDKKPKPEDSTPTKEDVNQDQKAIDKNELEFSENMISEEEYLKKKLQLVDKYNKDVAAMDAAEIAKEKKRKEEMVSWLQDTGQKVSDAIFANQEDMRQKNLAYDLENLEAQKNAELMNTTLTASQRNAIQKKYRAEEANEKLKAWKADQKAKEEQALINGLLAFTASLAGGIFPESLIPAALALATAGVEAALIASHPAPKFATGTPGGMVTPAGMKWVGEKGPELIYTPGGEKIMTNADSLAFLEKYQIPAMPSIDHLLDGTGVHIPHIDNKDVVEAISKLTSKMDDLKQVNVSIDRNGYKLSLLDDKKRNEILNNKGKY